jgi:DNA mismatch repair protein MutS2
MNIASRLGLPDEIINSARERMSKGAIEIETLLTDLMEEKQKLTTLRTDLEKQKSQASEKQKALEVETLKLKEQQQNLLWETRERLIREGDDLQRHIRDIASELKKARTAESLENARKALAAMREQINNKQWTPSSKSTGQAAAHLAPGDKVWLGGMNLQGTVVSLADSSGQLDIQVGNSRIKIGREAIEKAEKPTGQLVSGISPTRNILHQKTASLELDLRGKRADEIEVELDGYLNNAALANLNQVRIIHGLGTGVVRQIVRNMLSTHPLVKTFRPGQKNEGGDGATIVTFK